MASHAIGNEFTFLPMVLRVLCHLPPAFLAGLVPHTSLLIQCLQALSLLLLPCQVCPLLRFFALLSFGLECSFPKYLHGWLLLIIYSPCKHHVGESCTGPSSEGTPGLQQLLYSK